MSGTMPPSARESITPVAIVRGIVGDRMRGAGERRSKVAFLAAAIGVLAAVDTVLGPALAHFAIIRPAAGYQLFLLGAAEAALGVLVSLVAFARTGLRSPRTGRRLAWLGLLPSIGVLALAASHVAAGRGLPRIQEVTTNPADPPAFESALADPANAGRDLSYPPELAAVQRAAYPDLDPIPLAAPPAEALARSRSAAEAIGLEIVAERPPTAPDGEGALEARAVSQVFRFVDDVVVRVRPAPEGSVVDVRSRSRDATADYGVNAQRLRAFKTALTR
jgi:uncharacterized protein (DUF1499 family)